MCDNDSDGMGVCDECSKRKEVEYDDVLGAYLCLKCAEKLDAPILAVDLDVASMREGW